MLINDWIGYKVKIPVFKVDEVRKLNENLLLLMTFCAGGAEAGKKYMMYLALIEGIEKREKIELENSHLTPLNTTSSNLLH